MNEILSDTKTVLLWLFGIIGTLLGALGVVAMNFARGLASRVSKLEAEAVRKEDLEQLRRDMERRHEENRARLDQIAEAATGTHKRIDDLYRDLPKILREP